MKDLKSFKIRKKNSGVNVSRRDDGPVVEWPNRMTVVCKARLLWGDDWAKCLPKPGPVVEYSDDEKAWYNNSKCYFSGNGYFLRGPGC